jgi:malto-oligosyltrehalose trehalohydrolase
MVETGDVAKRQVLETDAAPGPDFGPLALSWGPEIAPSGAVRFRLWAPKLEALSVDLDGRVAPMRRRDDGWFETTAKDVKPGAAYRFVLPDGRAVPDPAARAQGPGGLDGPSLLVDAGAYAWRHADWSGRPWEESVLYELHVGTFTPEGTFRAAARALKLLAETGITAIEIMPVHQFPGERGWGYDPVLLYAPHHAYGTPDDMKHFVDTAHGLGLTVILDVVYNHFGPRGNYLDSYASFFHPERGTPWGAAIAFDQRPVRDFFIDNALYWLQEFNLDGLRLDAIHAIDDASAVHFLDELAERVNEGCPGRRRWLVTEDNRNLVGSLERAEDGGVKAYTATWNDDLHHVSRVIAARETVGYLSDFSSDRWALFARALAEGFAFQGEAAGNSGGEPHGEPSGHLPPTAFIGFLQNHDQVGNRAFGNRMETVVDPQMMRAMLTIFMLAPHIPLLFMGDEYGERRPFMYFSDYDEDLADAIHRGRLTEAANFGEVPLHVVEPDDLPDPNDPAVFEASKLDRSAAYTEDGLARQAFYRQIFQLRRRHIVPGLIEATGGAGRIREARDGSVAIDWRLNGRRLQLRANLSRATRRVPTYRGQIIHAEPAEADVSADGFLPAMSVVFALEML